MDDELLNSVQQFLSHHQFADISVVHTDIFEHALLQRLGSQHVPETCQFSKNELTHGMELLLIPPYGISRDAFLNEMQTEIQKQGIEIGDPHADYLIPRGQEWILLNIPQRCLHDLWLDTLNIIKNILAVPDKRRFYSKWTHYFYIYEHLTFSPISMTFIEHYMRKLNPHVSYALIWKYLIQTHYDSECVAVITITPHSTIPNWPFITCLYETNKKEKKCIKLTRGTLLDLLMHEKESIKQLTATEVKPSILPLKRRRHCSSPATFPWTNGFISYKRAHLSQALH